MSLLNTYSVDVVVSIRVEATDAEQASRLALAITDDFDQAGMASIVDIYKKTDYR